MTRTSLFLALFTLGLVGPRAALADEPDNTTTTTTTETTTTETTPAPEATPPPATVTLQPALSPSQACPPLNGARVDRDLTPGRGARITGGVLVGMGIATLVPGAVMLWWGLHHQPSATTSERTLDAVWMSGAAMTAVGAASFLAGIPTIAAGVHRGHEESRRSPVAILPSLAVGQQGAMAGLGGRF